MPTPLASVQLYSLAADFTADPAGSLDRLAAAGLRNVEAFDFVDRPDDIRAALDGAGMTAPTGHAPLLSDQLWTPDGSIPTPAPDVVFDAAATIGIELVIDPFVDPALWRDEASVAALADRMNETAEVAARRGLAVGYHNHAQEFVASFDGESAYERFVGQLDDRVLLELDLFWAAAGGQDVPALVASLGARLAAVHVKDGVVPAENPWRDGAEPFRSDDLDQRRPGSGTVPLGAALDAATNLRYAVIEYDNPPGDVFEDVAATLGFLRDGGYVR
ncbi:MAG: sugar phosphate isomerase/epimerase [Curtobacterium sp.]